jgi:hypothetical protein
MISERAKWVWQLGGPAICAGVGILLLVVAGLKGTRGRLFQEHAIATSLFGFGSYILFLNFLGMKQVVTPPWTHILQVPVIVAAIWVAIRLKTARRTRSKS